MQVKTTKRYHAFIRMTVFKKTRYSKSCHKCETLNRGFKLVLEFPNRNDSVTVHEVRDPCEEGSQVHDSNIDSLLLFLNIAEEKEMKWGREKEEKGMRSGMASGVSAKEMFTLQPNQEGAGLFILSGEDSMDSS
ncbi:hypothetical protein STEG23_034848 [Scotinomys teguina]